MPWCVQSFPSWGRMWPRASDLQPQKRGRSEAAPRSPRGGGPFLTSPSPSTKEASPRPSLSPLANQASLGNGPVDVRDDHLVVPLPQVDGGPAPAGALVLGGHTEDHVIGTFLQVQAPLGPGKGLGGSCDLSQPGMSTPHPPQTVVSDPHRLPVALFLPTQRTCLNSPETATGRHIRTGRGRPQGVRRCGVLVTACSGPDTRVLTSLPAPSG